MEQEKFSLQKRLESFKYAFNGLKLLLKIEHNSRIHLFVTICVVIAGFSLRISLFEWALIVLAVGFVFSMEIINSSIEKLADFVSPAKHETIKIVKDMAAAAVLVSAIAAAIIGLIIFIPKILDHLPPCSL